MTLGLNTRELARRAYYTVPPPLHPFVASRHLRAWRQMKSGQASQLHLGCGSQHLDGFVNIDIKITEATDYVGDISRLPCPDNSVERIETYHVFEHIPHPAATSVLAEWFRVLAPGGLLVIECPDFDGAVRQYLSGEGNEAQLLASVYGWQRYDGDTHFYGYNHARLTALLVAAGFGHVEAQTPQDYHSMNEPCLRMEAIK